MTIKDLKELIKDLPDDSVVGKIGHFGEIYEADIEKFIYYPPGEYGYTKNGLLELPFIDIGEIPD